MEERAAEPEGRYTIVCLSGQPWEVRLPTNRQQIMLRACRRGHDVTFVSTGDFVGRRLARRIHPKHITGALARPSALRTTSSLNLAPWGHKHAFAARTNAALTGLSLRARLRHSRSGGLILWIYDPCMVDVIDVVKPDLCVYDCVDDYAEQTSNDRRRRDLVSAADARAAERADLVFATTRALAERHAARNPRTHLVPNVGDFEHFRKPQTSLPVPPELSDAHGPIIGFAGNLLGLKVDYALLERAADARPDWTFVLVGPAPEEDAGLASLLARQNVRWLGHRPYGELPRYVHAFDVALIPYRSNAYTESCFPLKLYEYLAAGKAVVATGLPELADMGPDVVLASDAQTFVDAVARALDSGDDEAVRRRMSTAAANSWETRTARMLGLVTEELARR